MASQSQYNPSSSKRDAVLSPSTRRAPQASSHYHDLRQLQPEEDLIQLTSAPPTPHIELSDFDALAIHVGNPTGADVNVKGAREKLYVQWSDIRARMALT